MAPALAIEFNGERAAAGPLTWGQRNMIRAISENPPGHFNLGRVITPPRRSPLTPHRAVAVLHQLVLRHEALRTLIATASGEQRVLASGQIPIVEVDVSDVDGAGDVGGVGGAIDAAIDPVAEQLRQRLSGPAFDDEAELPLRVGLVTGHGQVQRVVLAMSHVAADGTAMDVLERDLRLLALRGSAGSAALQPLDLATRQHDAGDRLTQAALAHWDGIFRRMPPTMFGQAGPTHDPPCQRLRLDSPALLAATTAIAARREVSTSTVLLAATALMVQRYTGHRTVTIATLVGNRFQEGHDRIVTTLAQQGLFALDLTEPAELSALVPRAWRAAVRTYRHAYYDPTLMRSTLDKVVADRGELVDPFCCYNDVRIDPDQRHRGADPRRLLAEAARARELTTLTALAPLPRMHCRFCLQVNEVPGALTVRLTADTRYLPPESMAQFLRDTEQLVLDAAAG